LAVIRPSSVDADAPRRRAGMLNTCCRLGPKGPANGSKHRGAPNRQAPGRV
jgi:hypothetical protein